MFISWNGEGFHSDWKYYAENISDFHGAKLYGKPGIAGVFVLFSCSSVSRHNPISFHNESLYLIRRPESVSFEIRENQGKSQA